MTSESEIMQLILWSSTKNCLRSIFHLRRIKISISKLQFRFNFDRWNKRSSSKITDSFFLSWKYYKYTIKETSKEKTRINRYEIFVKKIRERRGKKKTCFQTIKYFPPWITIHIIISQRFTENSRTRLNIFYRKRSFHTMSRKLLPREITRLHGESKGSSNSRRICTAMHARCKPNQCHNWIYEKHTARVRLEALRFRYILTISRAYTIVVEPPPNWDTQYQFRNWFLDKHPSFGM